MRKDADYFPFICKEGKTFSILRSRYPLEGVGFFTELCIILTTTPDHHVILKDDLDFEYFVSRMNCEKEKAESIIALLVKTQKIHRDLWEKAKIIVIPDLLDSLQDAYERRNNDIITVEELVNTYINGVNDNNNSDNEVQKPTKESKVKETKVNNSKVKEVKHKHGEYNNVLLTDPELNKLKEKFPDYLIKIKELDEGIELKGYKYKSHYLAIIKWAERDISKVKDKKVGRDQDIKLKIIESYRD